MENEQINRAIHEFLGRGCWHDIDSDVQDGEYVEFCTHENCAAQNPDPNPDYCQSLDAVAAAEKKAVSEFGKWKYAEELFPLAIQIRPDTPFDYYDLCNIAVASALARATAIFNLISKEQPHDR